MSFWDKLFAWRSRRKGGRGRAAGRVYIVDAAQIASSNGSRSRLTPRAQLDALRQLSRFASKENIQVYAVFEGRPLNKAPDGRKFDEVFVRYAESAEALADLVIELLKSVGRGHDVVVITSDRHLDERVVASGGTTMRLSTFRKALESTPGGGAGERADRGDRQRSSRRRRRRRGPARESAPAPQPSGEPDLVRELIDVVEEPPRREPAPQPPSESAPQPQAQESSPGQA